MAGDLSGRLEVTGTGDEFDRLADSLNAMLDRIEHLLHGLKDVSDNIAHDLKTPLTRLRNRVETALAGPRERRRLPRRAGGDDRGIGPAHPDLQRAADDRAHRGRLARRRMTEVEASAIVRDVAELYEPVAEETGRRRWSSTRREPITLKASRELLGQALANLVDNAIKYAPAGGRRHGAAGHRLDRSARATTLVIARRRQRRRAFPRPTASGCCSASSGSKRAARSRAAASA